MPTVISTFLILGTLALLTALTGCETQSIWERSFVGSPDAAPLAAFDEVRVRQVNWDRVQTTLKEMESNAAKSDVHPEDWTEAQKSNARATLLRGLQVSDDPTGITILGRSDFRTTTALRPESTDEAELKGFARKIGASRVSWARSFLGKADTIVQEPVTTWTHGTDWGGGRDGDGHSRRPRDYSENSTTWVPIRIQADEYAYVAYFLRDQTR